MKKEWFDDEVRDLVNFSDKKFKTRLPCADEALKLNNFIWDMRVLFYKKDTAKLVAPMVEQSWLFRVFHIGQSRPWEIEVPGDAVWAVVDQARQMLNDNCDYLAELCGYTRKEDEK